MIRKFLIAIFFVLFFFTLVVFLIRRGILLKPTPAVIFSIEQVKEIIHSVGGEEALAKEAYEQMLPSKGQSYNFNECPAIEKMVSLMGDGVVHLWPSEVGMPAHIRFRQGNHFEFQWIYIFGTGSEPIPGADGLIPVGKHVYIRHIP